MELLPIMGVRVGGSSPSESSPPVLSLRDRVPPAPAPASRPARKSAPLKDRLERAWERGRFAAARCAEMPAAVHLLIDHHLHNGFFGDRLDGMRRIKGFGPDGTLEVALAPNRRNVPTRRSPGEGSRCQLCDPSFVEERGLAWRGWRVWPNAFPYVPARFEHILLANASHRGQSFSPAILNDMIDFQASAMGGRQLTLHYNGIAGNSQAHLHWQATRCTLPLQTEIDSGRMVLTDCVRSRTGRVGAFDHGSYCGILVEGDQSFVLRWADRIVARLNRDPLTRGAYNMVLLQPRNGRPRLVIFPRRADNLRPEVGSFGRVSLGGFNMGGIIVVPSTHLPPEFAEVIAPALRATQVPPAELPWLIELPSDDAAPLPHPRSMLHCAG